MDGLVLIGELPLRLVLVPKTSGIRLLHTTAGEALVARQDKACEWLAEGALWSLSCSFPAPALFKAPVTTKPLPVSLFVAPSNSEQPEDLAHIGVLEQEQRARFRAAQVSYVQLQRQLRACEEGSRRGCTELSKNDDPEAARIGLTRLAEWQCNRGVAAECAHAARLLSSDPSPQGQERRVEMLQQGCAAMDGESCGVLGLESLAQAATRAERQPALELLERACNNSHPPSCVELGIHYRVEQPRRSRSWYAKACELGELEACIKIQDRKAACRLKHADSCIQIGDLKGACAAGRTAWCARLCEAGNQQACEGAS